MAVARRLLYVITDLELGGVPLHVARLAGHVRRRGFEPTVACLSRPGPVSRILDDQGIRTAACGARGVWSLAALWRLRALMRDIRPELIHTFLFHANVATRVIGRLSGFDSRRVTSEIQTVEIERRWHLPVERWAQRWCRWIVGNSPSVVDHLRDAAHISPERLRLVMGGVDVDAIRAAEPIPRGDLGWPNDEPVILWVGRMDPIKGLDVLVDAFSQVRADQTCKLALVGDGPYRPLVERALAHRDLSDSVMLLGARTDVPRLLKTADVFAFPSRTEGLPNALLEALAAGLPIVATDAPGCRDVIRDQQTGLLVPRDDSPCLANALRTLLRDRDAARRLGVAAAQDAGERFGIARMFDDYLSLYRDLLDNVPSP